MTDQNGPLTGRVDVTTPHLARVYDWALGGKDNFAADRAYGEKIVETFPDYPRAVRNNRAFLKRAVRHLAEAGIRQFVDLGAGLPTSPSVHEIAREVHPDARVVYVDHDPIVTVHNQALLATTDGVISIEADVRRPALVLGHPALREAIDFTEPLGVVFVAVLHNVPDEDDPEAIVAAYREAMAPGSHLVFTQATSEGNPDVLTRTRRTTEAGSIPITFRSREQIARYFDGLTLLEPGLVAVESWRAEMTVRSTGLTGLAGVARKD